MTDENRQSPAETVSHAGDYFAWLIEIQEASGPTYFQMVDDDDWTKSHDLALHFGRKQDAQRVIEFFGWTRAQAVEHCWPAPASNVIAESNGHHWIEAFNLVCCRDCGIVRRADEQALQGISRRRPSQSPADRRAEFPSADEPSRSGADAGSRAAQAANQVSPAGAEVTPQQRNALIEECAQVAEAQDRTGYEWVRDSLWAKILQRAGANVRGLKTIEPTAPASDPELDDQLSVLREALNDD